MLRVPHIYVKSRETGGNATTFNAVAAELLLCSKVVTCNEALHVQAIHLAQKIKTSKTAQGLNAQLSRCPKCGLHAGRACCHSTIKTFSCIINQANKDAFQDLKSDWLTWVDIEDADTSLIRHIICCLPNA